jgi:hypothetical protein
MATSSCVQDVANRYYSSQRYPPKSVAEVQLLYRAPNRPFEVIADFQSRNEGPEAMRQRAAAIGADAVIVTPGGGSYSRREEWASSDANANTYTRLIASAIKYQ